MLILEYTYIHARTSAQAVNKEFVYVHTQAFSFVNTHLGTPGIHAEAQPAYTSHVQLQAHVSSQNGCSHRFSVNLPVYMCGLAIAT